MTCSLFSLYFDSSQSSIQLKQINQSINQKESINFEFLDNGLGIVSPPHFIHGF